VHLLPKAIADLAMKKHSNRQSKIGNRQCLTAAVVMHRPYDVGGERLTCCFQIAVLPGKGTALRTARRCLLLHRRVHYLAPRLLPA
jgi:hypothetical protein